MSKKTYDPRLVWPYSLLLCGPTSCGKTPWIVELLKSNEELCTHMPKKLIWIYSVEQPDLNPNLDGWGQICPPADFLNIAQKSLGLGS